MMNAAPERNSETTRPERADTGPDVEADLGASGAEAHSERWTSNESQSRDRGLVVTLWLLALLIAEVELWIWVLAHMYGS